MNRLLSIFFILFLFRYGYSQNSQYPIKILNKYSNFKELISDYKDISRDSAGIFGDSELGLVYQLEVSNKSQEELCLYVQNFSNEFLDINTIRTKHPLMHLPNNWSIGIICNFNLDEESCIDPNTSKNYLIMLDFIDLSNDSLIITFSSSTLAYGLDWTLPSLH